MRPQKRMGPGEGCFLTQKKGGKKTFYSPAEAWVMPSPSSTNPEEREFVIDCRASMHMLSKKDRSSGELETLRRYRKPITVVTANGEDMYKTNEETHGNGHDLHLLVIVQLLEDILAVPSSGNFCEETRLYLRVGQWSKSHICLTTNGKIILCNTENFVPVVVPGWSSSSSASSSSTSLPQDSSSTSSSPARLRSDDTHVQASGNRGDFSENQKQKEKEGSQSSNEKSIARSPEVVRGLHREPRDCRNASSRKHFS